MQVPRTALAQSPLLALALGCGQDEGERAPADPTPAQDPVAAAGEEWLAAALSMPPGTTVEALPARRDYPVDIAFSPDGRTFVAEAGDHTYGTDPEKAPPARIVTRISTLDPGSGEFRTIVDGLLSRGLFHGGKVIFDADGRMVFFQSTQGTAGPLDEITRAPGAPPVEPLTAADRPPRPGGHGGGGGH